MDYCLDIDGTLCDTNGTDYENALPKQEAISWVRRVYAMGHTVTLYTARGSKTGTDWRVLTEAQLAAWEVPYHALVFGKPAADLYIDDKAMNSKEFFL